jgi:hypothetical protein
MSWAKQPSEDSDAICASVHPSTMASTMKWLCLTGWSHPLVCFESVLMLHNSGAVQQSDYKPLETIAGKAIKEKQPFERLTLTKEDLLEMFQDNKYKQHIIKDKIADGSSTTVYRCGPLIDLCRGPHVPHTGRIKAFEIMKVSNVL